MLHGPEGYAVVSLNKELVVTGKRSPNHPFYAPLVCFIQLSDSSSNSFDWYSRVETMVYNGLFKTCSAIFTSSD